MILKTIARMGLALICLPLHAEVEVNDEPADKGFTARSLFSSGYGATFNAEAPQGGEGPSVEIVETLPKKVQAIDTEVIETEDSIQDSLAETANTTTYDSALGSKEVNSKAINTDGNLQLQTVTPTYAGLSYTLFKQGLGGEFIRTTPNQIFFTGDRVFLEVSTNIPGTLVTGNIDANFNATLLSVDTVKAGLVTRVPSNGTLKFVGVKGTEKLVFVLSEDSSYQIDETTADRYVKQCSQKRSTRSLVVDDDAGSEFQILNSDGSCSANGSGGRTRSIIVDVVDDVGYGVTDDDVLKSGKLLSLVISLEHQ